MTAQCDKYPIVADDVPMRCCKVEGHSGDCFVHIGGIFALPAVPTVKALQAAAKQHGMCLVPVEPSEETIERLLATLMLHPASKALMRDGYKVILAAAQGEG